MCVCNDVETCGCKNGPDPSDCCGCSYCGSFDKGAFCCCGDCRECPPGHCCPGDCKKYECPLGTYNEGPPNYWYNRHQALGYSAAPSAIPEEIWEPQYHPYNPVLEDAIGDEEEDTDWETTAADLSQCRPCPNASKLYRKDMRGATNVDDCRRWECRDDDFGISRALPGVPNCRVACENFRRSEAGGSMKDPKVEEIYCPVSCGYCAASPSQPTCPVTIKSAAVLSSVWSLAVPTIALFMQLGM
ncbi:hypothetical protein FOZ60_001440 [Perkinsus olseni]|uniref:Uncharacterized protein n=1 Tax=Perkinsus olseni TaxID=32597 RepID=A0A7J6PJJ3_PEROL|nr:hypothetical protein FOZ60_001440 [Perkinsus olseni]